MPNADSLAIFEYRQLEFGLSGLVLGFALVATGVGVVNPWAVTILPLALMSIGVLLANIGGALVGLRFAQPRTGHCLVLGVSGAVGGTIIVVGYLSTVTEFILGPPVVAGALTVAMVIGFVVVLVERAVYSG